MRCNILVKIGRRGRKRKDHRWRHLGRITIANSDLQLLKYARSLLKALGIHAKIYEKEETETTRIEGRVVKRRKRIIYLLVISRKTDIVRFREVVGFTIKQKQEVLDKVQLHQRNKTEKKRGEQKTKQRISHNDLGYECHAYYKALKNTRLRSI